MWNNLLLKLEFERSGVVAGECPIVGYEGLIEIEKMEFSISTAAIEPQQDALDTMEAGRSKVLAARQLLEARLKGAHRSVTRASVGTLSVTKRFDSASTAVLKALSTQELCIAEFVALRRSTLGVKLKALPWIKLSLSGATIQSVEVKLDKLDKGMQVGEDLVFDYEELAIEYMPPRSPGTTRFAYTRPTF